MKIQDLLKKEVMIMDLKATSKEAAIDEMITKLVDTGVVTNFAIFKDGIMKREAQTSTGLGDGIAMPHSKNAAVKEATVLFAKSASGVDYEALDGQPTDLFFMIAAPDGANDTHLAALAELSKYLLKEGFADQLRQAKTPDDIIATFDSNSISQETVAPQTVQSTSKGSDYIVAATVANGGSVVMAAVMAGGMVPPLAVFVATLLFKDKFNNEERQSGLTNIVMGLSFITEGAIPFGAADPARAIPSFIVGPALTGALVGLAGIKLMAPHGGIFVIALTSNPLLYILFILIGAVVSGVLFGLFRKTK